MTKFNFKVLNVDVFLSLSKMQMFGIQFGTMQNHYKKMLLRPRFKNAAIGPKNAA